MLLIIQKQKDTLKALGISKLNQTVEKEDNPQILGMVRNRRTFSKVENNNFFAMQLNKLKPAKGATKSDKRIGRGQGSGREELLQEVIRQSRSGYSRKVGFEGGQQPIQRRLPKFGFKPK